MYEKRNNYDVTFETYNSLLPKLDDLDLSLSKKSCFLGFDGYIDSLYSVAKTRESATEWTRMDTMKTFGERLVNIAGSSGNIERVLKRRISGGFAPNTCRAINGLGINIYLFAALGWPKINEIFKPLVDKRSIEAISITNPGNTLGLEFDDGKVMMPDFGNILNINWDLIMERMEIETILNSVEMSDMMGFGHWALMPHLTEIWAHLLIDILPFIDNLNEKLFFVDLADIKKRTKDDILQMLTILQKINTIVPVMLSLNDQEAIDISKALDNVKKIDSTRDNFADYIEGGKLINDELNISYLVIHSPHFATISTTEDHYWITEGYTSKPRFTTGAGDHFNAGVAAGLACDLSPPEAILMGNALTAIFVRTGNSPNIDELYQYLARFMDYIEKDNPGFP